MRRLAPVTVRAGTAALPSLPRPRLGWRLQRLGRWVAVIGGCAALAAILWFVASGTARHWQDVAERKGLLFSAEVGLRVEEILVTGRVKTPRDDLFSALAIGRGDPILGIDLAAVRKRLEAISWVRAATVERRLPNEINLVISERDPVALWQAHGHYFLIDRDGQTVGDQIDDTAGLPLVVGDGAPRHVAVLIDLLASQPDLQKRFKAAQWVGDRRWNITLGRDPDGDGAEPTGITGDIEIRLPEDEPQRAWQELADIEHEQKLLERQVGLIDLRLPDRLIVRLLSAAHEAASATPPVKPGNPRKPG